MDHASDCESQAEQKTLVQTRCEELLEAGCDSPHLLGFLVELLQWRLEQEGEQEQQEARVKRAVGLCTRLASDVDKIRARYWNFISDTITKKYVKTVQ